MNRRDFLRSAAIVSASIAPPKDGGPICGERRAQQLAHV